MIEVIHRIEIERTVADKSSVTAHYEYVAVCICGWRSQSFVNNGCNWSGVDAAMKAGVLHERS